MEHHFNVSLARTYGIEESILIHNLYFWISHDVANQKNYHDGCYWTFNSAEALSELFPYMSPSKIYRTLKNLVDRGFIKKGNYSLNKYDRTNWYAFSDNALGILQESGYDVSGFPDTFQNGEIDCTKTEDRFYENEKCHNIKYYIESTDSKHTDSKQEEKNIDKSISQKKAEFERWWQLYDKKMGRAKCYAKWLRLSDEERALCIANTPAYVASTPNKQYRKHPLTYLNGECWNDEIIGVSDAFVAERGNLSLGMVLSGDRSQIIEQSKKDLW